MARFATDGATQQELDDAKTYLTGSYPMAFASTSGVASQLSAFQRQGLDVGYIARRNSLIEAVTLDDVRRVSKKLFDPAKLTVVVAGTPVEGRQAPERPKAPVRPAPPPVASVQAPANPAAPVQPPVAGNAPGGTIARPAVRPPAAPGNPPSPRP
jgi:zinc protease